MQPTPRVRDDDEWNRNQNFPPSSDFFPIEMPFLVLLVSIYQLKISYLQLLD